MILNMEADTGKGTEPLRRSIRARRWIGQVLCAYIPIIKRHPVVAALASLICLTVWAEGFVFGKFAQRTAYLGAILIGVFITDLLPPSPQASPSALPVRRPLFELKVMAGCLTVSIGWLCWHFLVKQPSAPHKLQVLLLLGGIIFVWNIPLLLFDLMVMRYRPRDLGFRLRGLRCVLPITLSFAFLAAVAGAGFNLPRLIRWEIHFLHKNALFLVHWQGSVGMGMVAAFLIAALPEEFLRMSWQTRLGSFLKNPAVAWLLVALLWCALHLPDFYGGCWPCSLRASFETVPLGLLWGYIMHRTQSLIPTVLLHGTNYWGFQSF